MNFLLPHLSSLVEHRCFNLLFLLILTLKYEAIINTSYQSVVT
ncbi:hypothetical protein FDUTEX481_01393 [Tolypothrix sp. PCC 7601]|nr:hypothetical protein FDUTEX481_01393 [Tolypothrix sp. PCC 7601]